MYRLFERETNKAIADVITLADEIIDDNHPYTILIQNTLGNAKQSKTSMPNRYLSLFS